MPKHTFWLLIGLKKGAIIPLKIYKGGVFLVRLLEHANRYSKEKVFDCYKRTCQNDYWDYDSMTRKEMLERMIETYTPEYLVSICTTWELKALRRLLRNQDLEVPCGG